MTDIPAATREVYRIASLPGVKGIILGTHGAGIGMDDVNLLPVYSAIAETQLVVFVHPHYGIDQEHFGETGSAMGHVFPLAL